MDKKQIRILQDELNHYDTIIIHRHVRPDPDALGSQLAFKAALKRMHPNKRIYAVGEMVDSLAFFGQMDTIADDVYNGALIVVLDTANAPRIDDQRYQLGDKVIKIDHHPAVDQYGDLNIVNTSASSTSEIIFDLLKDFGYGNDYITSEIAQFLYLGIVGDTGRFLFNNTTKHTMQIISQLFDYELDHTALLNQMQQRSLKSIRFQGYVMQHFRFERHVGAILITKEILEQFDITANEASLFVNSMSEVEGIEAWVFAVDEGHQIRARIRSKRVVINELAAKYDGGGHPLASGSSVYSTEEFEQLIKDLTQLVN